MRSNNLSKMDLANSKRASGASLFKLLLALGLSLTLSSNLLASIEEILAPPPFGLTESSLALNLEGERVAPGLFDLPSRKDPFFAAALSWFVPGLGQVYLGQPLKGGLYWLIDSALFWSAILNVAHIDLGLERDLGFRFAIRFKDDLSSARIWTSVGLGICYLAFHIYNVLDAVESANEYNQQLLINEMRRDGLSFAVTPEASGIFWTGSF